MKRDVFVRCEFNYDADEVSRETGLACRDESLAQQSSLEESDINTIVRRFGLLGELPTGVRAPTYGDFTGVLDYQSALNAIIEADHAFMELPAEVRERFRNDPAEFVAFCSDESNREEAVKLGLVFEKSPAAAGADAPVAAGDSGA